MQKCNHLKDKMETYDTFIRTALGPSWEQSSQFISVSKIYDIGKDIFEKSGLENFVKFTVHETMKTVGPRSFLSAVEKCVHYLSLHEFKLNLRLNGLKVDNEILIHHREKLKTELVKLRYCRNNASKMLALYITQIKQEVKQVSTNAISLANQTLIGTLHTLENKYYYWNSASWFGHLEAKTENQKALNIPNNVPPMSEKQSQCRAEVADFLNHIGKQKLIELSKYIDYKARILCDQLLQHLNRVTNDIHQSIDEYISSILRINKSNSITLNQFTTVHHDNYRSMDRFPRPEEKQQHRSPWHLLKVFQFNNNINEEFNHLDIVIGSQHVLTKSIMQSSEKVQEYAEQDLRQVFYNHFDQIEKQIQDLIEILQTSTDSNNVCNDTIQFDNDLKILQDMCAQDLQRSIEYKKMLNDHFQSIA